MATATPWFANDCLKNVSVSVAALVLIHICMCLVRRSKNLNHHDTISQVFAAVFPFGVRQQALSWGSLVIVTKWIWCSHSYEQCESVLSPQKTNKLGIPHDLIWLSHYVSQADWRLKMGLTAELKHFRENHQSAPPPPPLSFPSQDPSCPARHRPFPHPPRCTAPHTRRTSGTVRLQQRRLSQTVRNTFFLFCRKHY